MDAARIEADKGCAARLVGLLIVIVVVVLSTTANFNESIIWIAAGTLVGGFLSLAGMHGLWEKRRLETAQASTISEAKPGLVVLTGRLRALGQTKAPVSNVDCCWWHAEVFELLWTGNKLGIKDWVKFKSMTSDSILYMEDETGKVVVEANRAAFKVTSVTNSFALEGPDESRVAQCLTNWGIALQREPGVTKKIRIVEQVIGNDEQVCAVGELTPVSRYVAAPEQSERLAHGGHDFWDAQMVLHKSPRGDPFVISNHSAREIARSMLFPAIGALAIGLSLLGASAWTAIVEDAHPLTVFAITGFADGMLLVFMGLAGDLRRGDVRLR